MKKVQVHRWFEPKSMISIHSRPTKRGECSSEPKTSSQTCLKYLHTFNRNVEHLKLKYFQGSIRGRQGGGSREGASQKVFEIGKICSRLLKMILNFQIGQMFLGILDPRIPTFCGSAFSLPHALYLNFQSQERAAYMGLS